MSTAVVLATERTLTNFRSPSAFGIFLSYPTTGERARLCRSLVSKFWRSTSELTQGVRPNQTSAQLATPTLRLHVALHERLVLSPKGLTRSDLRACADRHRVSPVPAQMWQLRHARTLDR
jgi:hypothetical protein